ncbi:MAG: ATP-dependent helicase, partial [Thermotogaceae bacterium]|nr:ATP-dependent helicase [Thermotogaceae bacterium]
MFLHGGEDVRLSKESYLENLDPEQLEAVLKSSGRSLIIAGPGSGKTRVITYKLAYLLQCGVKPSNILLVTFTRAAANEMIDRARRVTGQNLEDMTAGTFHHICNTFLRRYASKMGLMNNYTILDQEDSKSLIRHARAKIVGRPSEKKRFPSPSVLRSI